MEQTTSPFRRSISSWDPVDNWRSSDPSPSAVNVALISLAVFALLWAIARAYVQAVTGDEGVTYTFFAERIGPSHWLGEANNHVLNSLLIRLFTSIFGLSSLSLRVGALIGAVICIAAAFWISKLFSAKWSIQVLLFVCLIYNPFMFDFFVAARGYGLATGFLMSAIAVTGVCFLYPQSCSTQRVMRSCALSSAFLALSFTSNFPYAFVIIVTLFAILLWALSSAQVVERGKRWVLRMKYLAACTLPGLVVIVLLPLYTVLHFPKRELYDGGTSIGETLRSVVEASLFRVNPHIVNPLLFPLFSWIKSHLIWALCLTVFFQLLVVCWNWPKLRGRAGMRQALLAATLLGIVVVTLFAHYVAFHWFGLLIPRHRLALWIVPLCTLFAFLLASISLPVRISKASRGMLVAVLFVLGVYYFACLRLDYFKEWDYQQDVDKVYDVVAWYNHNRCVKDVEVSWRYHGAMTFYRSLSGRESLAEFTVPDPNYRLDKQIYVLNSAFEGGFIEQQGLKVVYHGKHTDIVVAIRPEFLDPPKEPCTALPLP